uniref:Membrane-associated kinase regulator 6 n=1 Tax=Ananas comosus var. bracteatus TaxID=296719 RepID=A0A6V7NK22_ANACO|nr:unnamed protein product [Ananas comosus var. bracteatus]
MDEELGLVKGANFSFTSPCFHSPEVVFADQIFSNGFLLPLHLISLQKIESIHNPFDSLDSSKPLLSNFIRSSSQNSSPILNSSQSVPISVSSNKSKSESSKSAKFKSSLARIWRRSTKKFLHKYASFLKPLYVKVKEMRLSSSKKSSNRTSSSRTSNASVSMEWCSESADNAVHEAILHCKKSFVSRSRSRGRRTNGGILNQVKGEKNH